MQSTIQSPIKYKNNNHIVPQDIIDREISIKINKYRSVHDRTLSEEFHSSSPNTQNIIKHITGNKTPTSNFHSRNSIIEEEALLNNKKKYMESTNIERDIMAQYGLVSIDFHNKNNNVFF